MTDTRIILGKRAGGYVMSIDHGVTVVEREFRDAEKLLEAAAFELGIVGEHGRVRIGDAEDGWDWWGYG